MCAERRLVDRVLAASFVEDLDRLESGELRDRRRACERVESELSMHRSMLQATLDVLRAELEQRSPSSQHAASILERLRPALVRAAPTARGARPKLVVPTAWGGRPAERLLSEGVLAKLPELTDDEIEAHILRVTDGEREVSAQRKRVQAALDAVQEALLAQYADGRADPMDLLGADDKA